MQNILKRKIYVSGQRGAFLQDLVPKLPEDPEADSSHGKETEGEDVNSGGGRTPMLLLNFTDEQVGLSEFIRLVLMTLLELRGALAWPIFILCV
jgi:hypothetical protein